MTITHLNRFHVRAARKQTKISDLSLNNIFAKLVLTLWISLVEVEFNILIEENEPKTKKFVDSINLDKKTTTQKWTSLLDYFFKKQFLKKQSHKLNLINLGHTNYHRYKTLKEILEKDLNSFIELRNKIAHGQWAVILNSNKNNKNDKLTASVWTLSKKELMYLRNLAKNVPIILNLLITSKSTFEKDFEKYINRIVKAKELNEIRYKHLLKNNNYST